MPRCRAAAAALAIGIVVEPPTSPAPADPQWRITSLHETVEVQNDGSVHVSEQIVFDFGTTQGHGIVQYLDAAALYSPGTPPTFSGISVKSPDGAPADTKVDTAANATTITVGAPGKTVTGAHTYDVEFTADHAAYADSAHPGTASLLWHAVDGDWNVPISDIEVTVKMPGAVSAQRCWQGRWYQPGDCASATADGASATFKQPSLAAGSQVTVLTSSAIGKASSLPVAAAVPYPPTSPVVSPPDHTKILLVAVFGFLGFGLLFLTWVTRKWGIQGGGRSSGDGGWSGSSDTGFGGGGDFGGGGGGDGGGHSGGW